MALLPSVVNDCIQKYLVKLLKDKELHKHNYYSQSLASGFGKRCLYRQKLSIEREIASYLGWFHCTLLLYFTETDLVVSAAVTEQFNLLKTTCTVDYLNCSYQLYAGCKCENYCRLKKPRGGVVIQQQVIFTVFSFTYL